MLVQARKKGHQSLCCDIHKLNIKGFFEIINYDNEHVMLVQLVDMVVDGNNAVSVAANWIFDSNYEKELPLKQIIRCYLLLFIW